MRIKELLVKDYEVIREAKFSDLGDTVVIAGPNGVGKTTVKRAICHIFQQGSPPPHCQVVLECTNDDERRGLSGDEEITLPNKSFTNYFRSPRKKILAKTRLIHINSDRQLQNRNFQTYTVGQIGNPEAEETNYDYSLNTSNDRFIDVCNTIYRMKSKLLTDYGKAAVDALRGVEEKPAAVNISVRPDVTEPFIKLFNQLLYPKKMLPVEIDSTSFQFKDEDGTTRDFWILSSGEKEVIAITFDIQLQNPSDSVVLIDEPELHLHPELSFRLLKTLNGIGERNQFWLFTHSADIIGNSLDNGVCFVRPKSRITTGNQVKTINSATMAELGDIPNLREAIGVVSLGKKLLFVEGEETSIDRNVFATIAKTAKTDLAIIASHNCRNIENLSTLAETLKNGLFGLDLRMIRDRDGLTSEQVQRLKERSNGHLFILPFYHIENAFLDVDAIVAASEPLLLSKKKNEREIAEKLSELARAQINFCVSLYVKSEIRFSTPSFDLTPNVELANTPFADLKVALLKRKNELLTNINSFFSDSLITSKTDEWRSKLEQSLQNGWGAEAQSLFFGKKILAELQRWLLGSKNVSLWEQIAASKDPRCIKAMAPLREIIDKL